MSLKLVAPQIDAAILSVVPTRNQKVAMTLAKTQEALQQSGKLPAATSFTDDDLAIIAERIKVLVSQGMLEGFGDLDLWRRSEVRLPNDK